MKGDSFVFAALMAAILGISASELSKAHSVFVHDLKMEEKR
jgi:hypothetical protein